MDDDMYNNIVISPEFQQSQSDFQRIIQTATEAALRHVPLPTINVNVNESMDDGERSRQRRDLESLEEYTVRIAQQRHADGIRLANEDDIQREFRLSNMIAAQDIRHMNESESDNEARLSSQRIRSQEVRDNMSESEHERVRELGRERESERYQNENYNDHATRLSTARTHSQNRRDNMTPEQRQQDREQVRDHMRNNRANQSEEDRSRINEQRRINRANRQSLSDLGFARNDRNDVDHLPPEYSLGIRNQMCTNCNALLFNKESKLKSSCCGLGDVKLPSECQLQPYPIALKELMAGYNEHPTNFFEYIRRFNSAFAFASFGAQASPPPGVGPYCFRIHGQTYHRLLFSFTYKLNITIHLHFLFIGLVYYILKLDTHLPMVKFMFWKGVANYKPGSTITPSVTVTLCP